ncbi:MAG: hemin-degrading factor [Burkholderiaceae bacterium]|nr:hemin-degrading factor [Burkholderiaceae bacterium]
MIEPSQLIRTAFATMRRNGPRRHRDIAKILSISEAELLAAHCGEVSPQETVTLEATRLSHQWPEQISILENFGPLMALTRNASCVHEKTGVYQPVTQTGEIGIVLGEAIDLRVFYNNWHLGFAVIEKTARGLQHSIQYFDGSGSAVHKIFLLPDSHIKAFVDFKNRFAKKDQSSSVSVASTVLTKGECADCDVDVAGLQRAWSEMGDTHDFFLLLKKYSVSRSQAFRLVGTHFAQAVRPGECRRILSVVADKKIPIMVFVSNPGVIQIHTGSIQNLSVTKGWLNVLDPDFNMHLRQDQIVSAWVVRKPTVDGVVTSLELFDHSGALILMLFGQRKQGTPENIQWRSLLDRLFVASRLCAA